MRGGLGRPPPAPEPRLHLLPSRACAAPGDLLPARVGTRRRWGFDAATDWAEAEFPPRNPPLIVESLSLGSEATCSGLAGSGKGSSSKGSGSTSSKGGGGGGCSAFRYIECGREGAATGCSKALPNTSGVNNRGRVCDRPPARPLSPGAALCGRAARAAGRGGQAAGGEGWRARALRLRAPDLVAPIRLWAPALGMYRL